ncbi:MFS transporter [Amphibiibacter pelophylacis]|uniref:MFS transporter n=1 Tax=Amphibiibacter pelophylacis TaxID=1799477 RepID=A0ACC6P409_9BURK
MNPNDHRAALADIQVTAQDVKFSTIVCFLAWTFAVYDFVLFANLLPVIAQDLGWTAAQTTGINTWVTIGTALVAFFVGPLVVDRMGRKSGIVIAVTGAALASGLTFVAGWMVGALGVLGLVLLILIRSLAGLGYAEQSINATYLNEMFSHVDRKNGGGASRGFIYSLVQSGWPVGSVIAAASIAILQPLGGWELCFIVGVFPAFIMMALGKKLKESPQFRARQLVTQWRSQGHTAEAEQLAREYHIGEETGVSPLKAAFSGESLRPTLTLSAAMLMNWLGILAFAFQGTLVLTSGKQVNFNDALTILIISNATGFLGYLFHGWLGDRIGRRNTIALGWFLAAFAFAGMLWAPNGSYGLVVALYSVGLFFLIGPYSALLFFNAESFPVETRATAGSFINALGQVGAILGGVLFTIHLSGLTQESAAELISSTWINAALIWGTVPILLSAALMLLARDVRPGRQS